MTNRKCGICGGKFESERGLKIHMSSKHKELDILHLLNDKRLITDTNNIMGIFDIKEDFNRIRIGDEVFKKQNNIKMASNGELSYLIKDDKVVGLYSKEFIEKGEKILRFLTSRTDATSLSDFDIYYFDDNDYHCYPIILVIENKGVTIAPRVRPKE